MNTRFEPAVERFLQACCLQYDALIEGLPILRSRVSAEAALGWIEMTAGFAGMHHPGRFADGAIENVALDVGRNLPRSARGRCEATYLTRTASRGSASRRRVLHVATTISAISGHTRTILNWIRKDPTSEHSLLLTSQGQARVPPAMLVAVSASSGQLVSLPELAPIIERARWLRRFAADTADLVILHLVPNDIVPIVAFADADTPPVALVNLADQCFWVGGTIADVVIHLREIGHTTSKELRFTRNDQLLPIPLSEARPGLGRSDARTELGIADSQVMLLSIGRSLKYAPSSRHNFFQTARSVLDRNPAAHLYLVGVRAEDHARARGFVHHDRMHFVGPIEDVTVYQRAADVYLEGFPFGSQTALLESVLPGIPCVPAYAPGTPLLATHDFALTGIVDSPRDEEDYITRVGDFVANEHERQRIGATLRERVLHYHIDESWNGYLEQVYRALENVDHAPAEIPRTASASRPVDLAIGEYHATRFAGDDPSRTVDNAVRAGILSAAYWLRQRGFHGDSFRLLRTANRNRPWDVEAMWFAAKLVPHRVVYSMSAR